jgi:hypothetical protein
MSTATNFKYYRPLPFCPTSDSGFVAGGLGALFLRDVDLADVMALFWNLETLEFTITASVTDTGGTTNWAETFGVWPLAYSGTLAPSSSGSALSTLKSSLVDTYNGSWAGRPTTATQPRDRVCRGFSSTVGFVNSTSLVLNVANAGASSSLRVFTDSINAGKYSLTPPCGFDLRDGGSTRRAVVGFQITYGGATNVNGSVSFGGYTWTWYGALFGVGTPTGSISISAASSFYTY